MAQIDFPCSLVVVRNRVWKPDALGSFELRRDWKLVVSRQGENLHCLHVERHNRASSWVLQLRGPRTAQETKQLDESNKSFSWSSVLSGAGLSEQDAKDCATTLTNQKVDESLLNKLNHDSLIAVGITTFGTRSRILAAARKWRRATAQQSEPILRTTKHFRRRLPFRTSVFDDDILFVYTFSFETVSVRAHDVFAVDVALDQPSSDLVRSTLGALLTRPCAAPSLFRVSPWWHDQDKFAEVFAYPLVSYCGIRVLASFQSTSDSKFMFQLADETKSNVFSLSGPGVGFEQAVSLDMSSLRVLHTSMATETGRVLEARDRRLSLSQWKEFQHQACKWLLGDAVAKRASESQAHTESKAGGGDNDSGSGSDDDLSDFRLPQRLVSTARGTVSKGGGGGGAGAGAGAGASAGAGSGFFSLGTLQLPMWEPGVFVDGSCAANASATKDVDLERDQFVGADRDRAPEAGDSKFGFPVASTVTLARAKLGRRPFARGPGSQRGSTRFSPGPGDAAVHHAASLRSTRMGFDTASLATVDGARLGVRGISDSEEDELPEDFKHDGESVSARAPHGFPVASRASVAKARLGRATIADSSDDEFADHPPRLPSHPATVKGFSVASSHKLAAARLGHRPPFSDRPSDEFVGFPQLFVKQFELELPLLVSGSSRCLVDGGCFLISRGSSADESDVFISRSALFQQQQSQLGCSSAAVRTITSPSFVRHTSTPSIDDVDRASVASDASSRSLYDEQAAMIQHEEWVRESTKPSSKDRVAAAMHGRTAPARSQPGRVGGAAFSGTARSVSATAKPAKKDALSSAEAAAVRRLRDKHLRLPASPGCDPEIASVRSE